MAPEYIGEGAGESHLVIPGDPSGEGSMLDEIGTPFQSGMSYGVFELMRTVDWLRDATLDANPELLAIFEANPSLKPISDAYLASKDSSAGGPPPPDLTLR